MKVEIQRFAWSDTGSCVPGAVDILSDFTGANLRALDIALLMCYDEIQKVVAANRVATQYKLLNIYIDSRHGNTVWLAVAAAQRIQPCSPGNGRSICAPAQLQ